MIQAGIITRPADLADYSRLDETITGASENGRDGEKGANGVPSTVAQRARFGRLWLDHLVDGIVSVPVAEAAPAEPTDSRLRERADAVGVPLPRHRHDADRTRARARDELLALLAGCGA